MLGFIWPKPFFCMGACEFVQIAGGAQHDWSVRRILQFKPAKVMRTGSLIISTMGNTGA